MDRFRDLVVQALDDLPEPFRRKMNNVDVVVEENPPSELQRQFRGRLLGLYQGVPLSRRSAMDMQLPDKISLFKRNIEGICSSEEEICSQVRATLMHEIGHHFGLSEEELEDV